MGIERQAQTLNVSVAGSLHSEQAGFSTKTEHAPGFEPLRRNPGFSLK
jgi:hypothetical protein